MNCEYFCRKKTLTANEVEKAQIFFSNGDFFTLTKKETDYDDVVYTITVVEESYVLKAKLEYINDVPTVVGKVNPTEDGVLCIAMYDDEVLMTKDFCDVSKGVHFTANIPVRYDYDTVKVMLWKDKKSMTPLCEAVEIDLTE